MSPRERRRLTLAVLILAGLCGGVAWRADDPGIGALAPRGDTLP